VEVLLCEVVFLGFSKTIGKQTLLCYWFTVSAGLCAVVLEVVVLLRRAVCQHCAVSEHCVAGAFILMVNNGHLEIISAWGWL